MPSSIMRFSRRFENVLFHLEFGNAVSQQTADPIGTLEHSDPVSGLVQLGRSRKSCRTGSDDRHALSGTHASAMFGLTHPSLKGAVDDGDFDVLDRHRIGIDAEHT